jgi:hypothetical protein
MWYGDKIWNKLLIITTLHIPQQNEVLKKKTLIGALFPYPLSQRAGSEVEIV